MILVFLLLLFAAAWISLVAGILSRVFPATALVAIVAILSAAGIPDRVSLHLDAFHRRSWIVALDH
jgi:hypothetical protein